MPTSYLEIYQNTIAALARPLTSKDKVPAEQLTVGERRLNVRLPKALRDFYLLAGQRDRQNPSSQSLVYARRVVCGCRKVGIFVICHLSFVRIDKWLMTSAPAPKRVKEGSFYKSRLGVNVINLPIYKKYVRNSSYLAI
ncbi:MAG TPA: hypothetical protein DEV81_16910, partial [Cyanobacteria bacterium UBA11049]|nr:hypothetical protein [Cyanobacteria bacterium UBA11049]